MQKAVAIKGGASLISQQFQNLEFVSYFLQNPEVAVNILSTDSMFGYVFRLDIPASIVTHEENNEPIRQYVLKLSFVCDLADENPESDDTKWFVNQQDFVNEAILQDRIWTRTHGRNNPVCPSMIYYNMFDPNTVLNLLGNNRPHLHQLIDEIRQKQQELSQRVQRPMQLGCMLMSIINGVTFKTIRNNIMGEIQYLQRQITKKNKKQLDKQIKSLYKTLSTLVIKIVVKNMRLLLECGYLHDDLHENNVLVTTDSMEPYLIDFGKMYTEEHLIERFPDVFTIKTTSQTRVTFLESFLHIINTNNEVIIYDFVEFFLSALMNFLGFEWANDYLTPYDETDIDDDEEESDELSMEKAMAIFNLLRQTFIPYDESQTRLSMHQMYVNGGLNKNRGAKQNRGLNKNRGAKQNRGIKENRGIKQKSKKGKSRKNRKTKRKQSKY